MDEKRGSFRVPNPGTIRARYENHDLGLVDISLSGALVKPGDINLMEHGVINIIIHHFSMQIPYELLKKEGDNLIITFNLDADKDNRLLSALKNVRSSAESAHLAETVRHEDAPKINQFMRMGSLYAIRLYSLLDQYRHAGHEIIKLDYLRLALGLDMLKSYQSYPVLKRKILEPVKHEINEKSDLIIDFTEITENNAVVAVKFTLVPVTP